MRILVTVSDQVWGGKHRYMLDTIRGLRQTGHDVTTVVEQGSAMSAVLRAAGLPVIEVPPFGDSKEAAAGALAGAARSEQPDIVCVTGRHDSAAWLASESAHELRPALVLYRHSAFPLEPGADTDRLLERAGLVIATSREQAERQFAATGHPGLADKVEVITSGISAEFVNRAAAASRSSVRKELGLDSEDFILAVVGRLSWEKNIAQAIEAFAQLVLEEEGMAASLLVVGDGPLLADLQKRAADLGVADSTTFVGHRDDIPEVLAAVDAVVLTSSVPETGPLALKEAMAAARPVIATRIGGIPEFVADEVSGLLVEDTDQLREAMRRLILDEAFAAELGRHGRDAILTEHRLERRTEFLSWRLDLLAISALPLDTVLAELQWDGVRLRTESEGGFIFVPRTSQLLPVDAPARELLERSVAAADPMLLAASDEPGHREFVATLFRMGALVRRGRFDGQDR
ncbi:glycosyltransferase family 4 protein [Streptomyces sp. NPDC059104]|uniref:glycosyltransferase family 4 protein n=1 Tax=Streptomyces sp. NPDC059104 TaxID=3346729 RepID=UPI0036AB0899